MRKFLKNVDKRKFLGTIVGLILFSCVAFYFTYARYEWRSADTDVTINFEDVVLNFDNGGNVNVSNIGPILNYTDGVKATFTATSIAGETFPFVVKLDITSISETLLVESFKYKLMRDTSGGTNYTEEVASGNFSTFGVGQNIIYVETMAPTAKYSYQFVVYIDGRIYNDNNMQENSLVSTLIVTDDDALTDYSGNNNHAVNMGATWDMANGTITTDGVSTFVNCGFIDYDFENTLSFATRVKFNEIKYGAFFGNWEIDGGSGFYMLSTGTLTFEAATNSEFTQVNSSFNISSGTWYTVVGVYDGSKLYIYINGQLSSSTTLSGNVDVSNYPVLLGANPEENNTIKAPISVTFDQVLLFDRALTASEIATDYAGVVNPTNTTDLLAYYTFDY